MRTAWWWLAAGILLEVAGTTCMKLSHGLTRPWPTLGMFVFYLASLTTVAWAVRDIDLSVAYAVWSAVGTLLVVGIGIQFFGEAATATRLFWLCVTLAGIIGLRTD